MQMHVRQRTIQYGDGWQRENGLIKGRWHQRREPFVMDAGKTFEWKT